MTGRSVDLAVIGGGPAGISAATVAARHGLKVLVLDEHPQPGGRLLGQLHEMPGHGWWRGAEIARTMLDEARAAGVEIVSGAAVYGLRPQWEVLVQGTPFETVTAPRLLIATGAAEKSVPIPGWTTPGTMTAGGAQVMVNVHRVKPGKKALMVGVNVLTLTIARELALAGVEVAGIVLPPLGPFSAESANPTKIIAAMSRMAGLAPSPLLRLAGSVFGPSSAGLGAALYPSWGVKVWGLPMYLRTACVEIRGQDEVTGVVLEQIGPDGTPTGRRRTLEVDLVCISDGLYPLAELASAAGCAFAQVPELGGRVPLYGSDMRTTAPGVFVAGNVAGIEGAQVAAAQGQVAGYGIVADAGRIAGSDPAILAARTALAEVRRSSPIQFHPRLADGLTTLARAWEAQVQAQAEALGGRPV
ncbi:MAG TPA: NAD(P)/FAD-dependent oxidoreductase [Symbiobacteriaceae bacterium]|jgi:sarcosine oxidase subunit alpha